MAGTKVENVLLTNGQNEGIEVAVLPAPQLRTVSNMRLRAGSRWGKRFGHSALATGNLGAATGRFRAIGGALESGFVVVDDVAYNYSRATSTFVSPTTKVAGVASSGTLQTPNAISGWVPRTSFTPVPVVGRQLQTVTPCAQVLALGALWTVTQSAPVNSVGSTDGVLRVVATDPTDQTVLGIFDFAPVITGFGGLTLPRRTLVGSTLLLTYIYTPAAGAALVMGRSLTSIAGGFSAEVAATGGGTLSWDIYPYNSTHALFVTTYGGNALTFGLLSTAFAQSSTVTFAEGNPITTSSIVGSPSTPIYVGYSMAAITTARVRVYVAPGGALTGTVTVSVTSAARPLLCPIATGGVRCVYGSTVAAATTAPVFSYVDVSPAAIVGSTLMQPAAFPISMPFSTPDGSVYIWAMVGHADRASTLLKLINPNAIYAVVSCHIELSVQDLLATANTFDLQGLPLPVLVTDADYVTIIPSAVSDQSGGVDTGHIFRAVQVTHFTGSAPYRSSRVSYADSVSFVPLGALTRVDDYGPAESGFVHKPAIGTLTSSGGGAMTPSSDYYYTAVYRVQNSAGRYEVSAPCTPVKVTLGAGDSRVTIPYLPLCLSGRWTKLSVTIEIYRTLANGQTFYLDKVITPVNMTTGAFPTVVDSTADTTLAIQKALYTQVGQTLANAFPPAARFSCVGGQRIFLGGLVRPDVVQASKLIFGDQSPSFADADAFRIVLPAPCTGIAWMDTLCMFTAEGIYIASGDGPNDDGNGDFGTLTRMPYELGCIEPRSVVVVDDGCFFQTARGLYLLPRGFGTPVPAGDTVQDTLASYPIITGCATLTKSTEQSVYWTCCDTGGVAGNRVVYDLAHKAWSVDAIFGSNARCGIGQWLSNELALFSATVGTGTSPLLATDSSFADAGNIYTVALTTGDLRPFGVLSEGAITKVQVLALLKSACTLNVGKSTEWGTTIAQRVFALAGGDYAVGQTTVTDVELSPTEAREAMRLRIELTETSAVEGLAFIALAVEHEQGEGLKRASPLSRVT